MYLMTPRYTVNYFHFDAKLKHDQLPDISYDFKPKRFQICFDKDEFTLSQAKKIEQEWPL